MPMVSTVALGCLHVSAAAGQTHWAQHRQCRKAREHAPVSDTAAQMMVSACDTTSPLCGFCSAMTSVGAPPDIRSSSRLSLKLRQCVDDAPSLCASSQFACV